jgi:hypothetical protein
MIRKCKLKKVTIPKVDAQKHLRIFRIQRMFNEIFDVKHYAPANVDSSPHRDARALAEAIGEQDGQQFVRSFMDGIPREARAGEFKAYSTEDGVNVKADVYIKRDGTIELNGASYVGLVKIVELTAKLNQLVAEVRAHTHPLVAAPNSTFSDFVKEHYENTTVNHGGGI